MKVVLLSGGSGKRLWPLSNDVRSKQFIKIFKNSHGEYQSMLERVYDSLQKSLPQADIIVATYENQVASIINQLGNEVELSIEPCRKDTFPAIALAAAYLHDVKGTDLEEPIVVCPVDPQAEIEYFQSFQLLAEEAGKSSAALVLMGIRPDYPSEKYGYIIPVSKEPVSRVKNFKEKPSIAQAVEYIQQGALWNCGVFAAKLGYMLKKAHEIIDFKDYYDLLDKYKTLEEISFDYAVVEKERNLSVMGFSGQWLDLGTWNTLTAAMEDNCLGKGVLSSDCQDVHIINELDIPILAMGMNNVVISASPEGILVSDKEKSSYIKPYVKEFSNPIMFAERSWGSFKVLDIGRDSCTMKLELKPGCAMSYHSHQNRDEVWVVVAGSGKTVVDGMKEAVGVGDVITMEAGCRHTVLADTSLTLIEIQLGKNISVLDKRVYHFEE